MRGTLTKKLHPDFIQEVKDRVDIVEVISGFIELKRAGKEFLGCCPFHNESTPSLTVTPAKGLAYCFGCSWGGNAIKFLMEAGRVSFREAVLELARSANIPIKYEDRSTGCDYPDPLPRPLTPLAPVAKEGVVPVKDYTVDEWRVSRSNERLLSGVGDAAKALVWLQQRGISREMVAYYRLGLEKRIIKPDESRPDYKEEYGSIAIFIPVPDRPGRFYVKKRVAPWLAGDQRPEYLANWAQFGLPATIWFSYAPPDAEHTYFTEGEWDAILLGELARQRGEKVAVACSTSGAGTVPKQEQLDKLPGKVVTIFYDRDQAGEKGAQKLAAALGERGWIGLVPTPDDCEVKGWDVGDAILAGYGWEDFEAADLTEPEEKIEVTAFLTDSKSADLKRYIKPIQELPQVGFHVVRQSQDELLERFDALQSKRGQEWLKLRQFTPDVTIDFQYFNYDFKPGEDLAIRSGLGTGKSYFTNAKWLANPDEGAVLGGYRNCLNEQFCTNGEKLNGRPWYQIQADLKGSQEAALIADPQSRVAGAVDSWVYFKSQDFNEKKVIFDEAESVAKHLNESNTAVSFYRDIIKQRVSDALTNSTANLIADGNLRDFTVEYLEKLSGGRKFTKILNEYTGNRGKVYLYNGSCRKRQATEEDVKLQLASAVGEWISFDYKADDYSKLHRLMMELPTDIPMLILSDSQKKCEAWDREATALGRKAFRLDSTSSGSDLGKLFLRDSRNFILSEKIDTVILSPSAESGISIELLDELKRQLPGYFKYEFSFFFGVSATDPQTQTLGRNRDPYTTKFCYVQSHSLASTKQITESQDSNDVFSTWIETMKDCASLSLQGIEEDEILRLALEKLKKELLNPHLQYESKLLLKESFERTHPRLCLEYALREAGYEVVVVESREDDISDLKAIQEEIALEKATAIFKSKQITSTEADKLARKLNKAPEERHQITKSRLLSRLPGLEEKVVIEEKKISSPEQLQRIEESELEKVVTVANMSYEEWKANSQPIPEKGLEVVVQKPAFSPEFINKVLDKDRYFINRLESQFLLKNPEVCKLIQQHKWHKKLDLLTDPDKGSFGGLPVSRYRSKWLEIHTLLGMGISFFLDPSNRWSDETPEAVAFWEKGKIPRIARNIGVSHEDDPCRYIGKVLQKYGLHTQEKRKQKPDGARYREYSIKPIDSLSQAVYECVEQRINSQVSEFIFDWKKIIKNSTFSEPESLDTTELQRVHMAPDNLIKTRGDVDVDLSVKASELEHNTSICGEGREGVDTRTDLERLIDALEVVRSLKEFSEVVGGREASMVEDAIAFAPTQPRRQQLTQWLEQVPDDTASAVPLPEKPSLEVSNFTELLREAIAHGFDTVCAVLSRWTSSERWGAVLNLEERSADDMQRLMQVMPNWVEMCDA